jgi:hypothetical protein
MTSQYGAYALHMHVSGTHARAHTKMCNICCFSTATMIRERASMLRYTYNVCLVCMYIRSTVARIWNKSDVIVSFMERE